MVFHRQHACAVYVDPGFPINDARTEVIKGACACRSWYTFQLSFQAPAALQALQQKKKILFNRRLPGLKGFTVRLDSVFSGSPTNWHVRLVECLGYCGGQQPAASVPCRAPNSWFSLVSCCMLHVQPTRPTRLSTARGMLSIHVCMHINFFSVEKDNYSQGGGDL
jgi:hypothetical protein